jgi:hypothetical protein
MKDPRHSFCMREAHYRKLTQPVFAPIVLSLRPHSLSEEVPIWRSSPEQDNANATHRSREAYKYVNEYSIHIIYRISHELSINTTAHKLLSDKAHTTTSFLPNTHPCVGEVIPNTYRCDCCESLQYTIAVYAKLGELLMQSQCA